MTHSIVPPSGASAWRKCAMWVNMQRAYPQGDTPESMEGTAAHWCFEEMLRGHPVAEGQIAPNGIVITQEMVEGAELFVETVQAQCAGLPIYVEQRVAIPRVHAQCYGTPDLWAFDRARMILHVLDYKFGHGFVDEFENDQGVCYTDGIVDVIAAMLKCSPAELDQVLTVNFTIVQPRCFQKGAPVRTWTFRASDIRAHVNILHAAAERALAPNPTATTNAECRNCTGRAHCPALQQGGYVDAEYSAHSSPVELSPAAASLELKMLEHALQRLKARVTGLEEVVTAQARSGARVPYHKLESSPGRRHWTVPADQIAAMGLMMGKDLNVPKVVTPNQAAKLGIDASVIAMYSSSHAGAVKLVAENPADARRVFSITPKGN